VVARRYNFRHGCFSHQPVLFAVAEVCTGPIAECGCGDGSTYFLHEISERRGVKVISLETDPGWLERFAHLESEHHEFRLVEDWETELRRPEWGEHWGLVFVDQSEDAARLHTVNRVRAYADYVILHDSGGAPDSGLGREIRPIRGPHDLGRRDFGELFGSWREYFPPPPWPHIHGPPTLLGSNRVDVGRIDVDYHRHLPYWWRVARHFRALVPQRIRMRIGNRIGWRLRPGFSDPHQHGE